jgi:sulfur carrier protein
MDTMTITVNGTQSATSAADLLHLVAELTGRELASTGQPVDGSRLGVAVAVNAAVIPRSQWAGRKLTQGDDVELVTAVQGG